MKKKFEFFENSYFSIGFKTILNGSVIYAVGSLVVTTPNRKFCLRAKTCQFLAKNSFNRGTFPVDKSAAVQMFAFHLMMVVEKRQFENLKKNFEKFSVNF